MFNLHNKIITVILTLIIMINYCNGYINDKNVLSDIDKFTIEKIETCEQFNEKYSQYLTNNYQYFCYYSAATQKNQKFLLNYDKIRSDDNIIFF